MIAYHDFYYKDYVLLVQNRWSKAVISWTCQAKTDESSLRKTLEYGYQTADVTKWWNAVFIKETELLM
jgi:hypothetical protein